jgi:hypothetical protein
MNRRAVSATAAALALVAAGCGSSSDAEDSGAATASTTTTAASQSSSLPAQLAGSYTRSVTEADIDRTQKKRSEAGPNQEKPKPSRVLLFLEPTGMTARTPKADFVVQQDYSATDGGQLVIQGYQHPEEGAFCGPEIPQNAAYTWKVSGDKLTLHATKDPCADRDSTLTGVWTRK